jgi:hypothetical protein
MGNEPDGIEMARKLAAAAPPEPAPELPEGWQLVQCDHTGHVTRFGVYWRAVHADGTMAESSQYRDSAARAAWAANERSDNGR